MWHSKIRRLWLVWKAKLTSHEYNEYFSRCRCGASLLWRTSLECRHACRLIGQNDGINIAREIKSSNSQKFWVPSSPDLLCDSKTMQSPWSRGLPSNSCQSWKSWNFHKLLSSDSFFMAAYNNSQSLSSFTSDIIAIFFPASAMLNHFAHYTFHCRLKERCLPLRLPIMTEFRLFLHPPKLGFP